MGERGQERTSPDSKRTQAAELLAAGLGQAEVGRVMGVTSRTIRRWAKEQGFRAAVESARSEQTTSLVERLAESALSSLATLERIRDDESVPSMVRTKASAVILQELRLRRETAAEVRYGKGLYRDAVVDYSALSAEEVDEQIARLVRLAGPERERTERVPWVPTEPLVRAQPELEPGTAVDVVRPVERVEVPDDPSPAPGPVGAVTADEAPVVDGSEASVADAVVDEPEWEYEQTATVVRLEDRWQPDRELTKHHTPWRTPRPDWSDPIA